MNRTNPIKFDAPVTRRQSLQRGATAATGLLLAQELSAPAVTAADTKTADSTVAGKAGAPRAKSVIQIFLWGGMSHNDTWDPKPDAGRDYTG